MSRIFIEDKWLWALAKEWKAAPHHCSWWSLHSLGMPICAPSSHLLVSQTPTAGKVWSSGCWNVSWPTHWRGKQSLMASRACSYMRTQHSPAWMHVLEQPWLVVASPHKFHLKGLKTVVRLGVGRGHTKAVRLNDPGFPDLVQENEYRWFGAQFQCVCQFDHITHNQL